LKGQDIWCYQRDIYGESNADTGTFGDYYIGNETYLHKIPDSIPSEYAAPLQCAGATVYAALVNTLKPGDRVGIIGIGGLGHLAIQFAAKLGAEVVVFSSTPAKEAEAKAFGASEYCLTSEPEKISAPVDVLLLSGKGHPDWSK
jgi:D-arabinose 1-dehydrogenase-like Zn-dependent alcohol dehydrogenase